MKHSNDRSPRRVPTMVLNLSRRRFLARTGWTGTAAYLAPGGVVAATWLRGRLALARDLEVLDEVEADSMLAMARCLYPHDHLGDEYYRVVVAAVDREMTADRELSARIKAGFAEMKAATGIDFSELGSADQIANLQQIEDTRFFGDMLAKTTLHFYNNPAVWPHFGFEGSSWEKGGYIDRGFDDADWIPDP